MSAAITPADLACWRHYAEAAQAAVAARQEVFARREALVELVRAGFQQPGERAAALDVAAELGREELEQLFPDLLSLASFAHGLTERSRQVIQRLPTAWLRARVDDAAVPLLAAGGAEEYQALLPLYERIDRGLARSLAARAAASADPDIKEVGDDYLQHATNGELVPVEEPRTSSGNGAAGAKPQRPDGG